MQRLHPSDIRLRLLLVTASVIVVLVLLMLARGALFPFILSSALAYLLYPVVRALERLMPWRERLQGLRVGFSQFWPLRCLARGIGGGSSDSRPSSTAAGLRLRR